MSKHVACMNDRRDAHKVSMGKPEAKKQLRRPKRRREDKMKMGLQEVDGEAWTGLIWLRVGHVADACECGNEHSGSIKRVEFLDLLRTC